MTTKRAVITRTRNSIATFDIDLIIPGFPKLLATANNRWSNCLHTLRGGGGRIHRHRHNIYDSHIIFIGLDRDDTREKTTRQHHVRILLLDYSRLLQHYQSFFLYICSTVGDDTPLVFFTLLHSLHSKKFQERFVVQVLDTGRVGRTTAIAAATNIREN